MAATNQQPGRVQQALEEFRRQVLKQEALQMREMAQRWLEVTNRLEAQIQALAFEAVALRAKGQSLSRSKLYQMERYRDLLAQARAESTKYQAWAADLIAAKQRELAKLGIESTQALIRASYLEAGAAAVNFNLLPVEAIEAMIGYATNGSPLYDLLVAGYPDSIEALTQSLISAIARGANPRQTAREMAKAMDGELQRALVIARTEQLRAFRTAATEQMKASGVVEGWIWRSALQDRTCLACLAMDGTEHTLDEELDDHPNGRCFKQPIVTGLTPVQAQSGADWFAQQPAELQRTMMGDQRFEAWQQGQIQFSDLVTRKHSEEWGSHVAVAPLEALQEALP
jgi:SPP1 gp7 family putative phage head morphogenesis protein